MPGYDINIKKKLMKNEHNCSILVLSSNFAIKTEVKI